MINHVQFPALGLEFTINRVAFSIGSFQVYWYGILIAAAIMIALVLICHLSADFGLDSDKLTDVFLIGVACGIICARAYYVVFAPFQYTSLQQVLDVRDGGLAIYGGIIGGFFFGAIACKIRKVKILPAFDVISIALPLGQCIGRWGNFMNQEAFGTNTDLPWGMISENTKSYLSLNQQELAAQGVTVDPSLPVHPTFLYESLWCLIIFCILMLTFRHRKFHGDMVLRYVILYGAERFVVEGFRTDSLLLPMVNLRVSQCIAAVSVFAAVYAQILIRKRIKKGKFMVPLYAAEKISAEDYFAATGEELITELPADSSHRQFAEANKKLLDFAAAAKSGSNAEPHTEAEPNASTKPDTGSDTDIAAEPDTEESADQDVPPGERP